MFSFRKIMAQRTRERWLHARCQDVLKAVVTAVTEDGKRMFEILSVTFTQNHERADDQQDDIVDFECCFPMDIDLEQMPKR